MKFVRKTKKNSGSFRTKTETATHNTSRCKRRNETYSRLDNPIIAVLSRLFNQNFPLDFVH